jgi:hypothetical protein
MLEAYEWGDYQTTMELTEQLILPRSMPWEVSGSGRGATRRRFHAFPPHLRPVVCRAQGVIRETKQRLLAAPAGNRVGQSSSGRAAKCDLPAARREALRVPSL